MSRLSFVVLFFLVASLAACGFQLRGQVAELPFERVYITAPAGLTIGSDLERAINTHTRAQVVKKMEKAEVVIQIISAINEKRILSLSGGGRVREFELGYRVATRLLDPSGAELLTLNEIRLTRILPFLDAQVLAKVAEEEMLYKDMQNDAVQQIIRQISAINPG
ncbi:LPS assembly lipoprotein LptE [Nitrosomonas sp. ANs5]|uniref:LPS-assembly lipoprotein LptE n=1 Tax=Nitrosomonas sp. ANs5 TaxID=3423941 RepID=UPI003D3575A1